MDTSAFDEDDGLDVNVVELYNALPEDIQHTIGAIFCLSRLLAKVGLLVTAVACCALAFFFLISWLCLYWLLTYLVLGLSVVLRFCYEDKEDSSGDAAGGRSSPNKPRETEELNGTSDEESNTASKDAGVKSDPHTAADLDLFEAFLNSPRDPIQREIHVQEAVHQSCQHSARLAEDGGQERSRLGAEEDSLPENGRDENKSLGEHEDLENSESPVLQRKADPDKSIQLSFEPQLTGTAEQLKEAASLQAAFTKARSSGSRVNKYVPQASASRPAVAATSAAATNGTSRPLSQLHTTFKVRPAIPMLNHHIENNKTPRPKDPVLQKTATLPPHLRGKANAQKRVEDIKQADEGDSTPPASTQNRVQNEEQGSTNHPNQVINSEQPQVGERVVEKDIKSGDKVGQRTPGVPNPKALSFAEVLKMDQRELSQKLTNIVGDGSERTAIRDPPHESAPPIVKPARRSMTMEQMKMLNHAPGKAKHWSDTAIWSSQLEARLRKLAADYKHIESGRLEKIKQLARLGRTQVVSEIMQSTEKSEALRSELANRSRKITVLKSQLTADDIELAKCMWRKDPPLSGHAIPGRIEVLPVTEAGDQAQPTAHLDNIQDCVSIGPEDTTDSIASLTPSHIEEPKLCQKQATPTSSSDHSGDRITGVVPTKFNATMLPALDGGSSTEHLQRYDALRKVVEAINKRVPEQIESTTHQPVDLSTTSDDTLNKSESVQTVSSHEDPSPGPSRVKSEGNAILSPPCAEASRAELPNSLSAQAAAFQPQRKPGASNLTTATKQSTLRPCSNAFVPIANEHSEEQATAGRISFNPSDDFISLYAVNCNNVYHTSLNSTFGDTSYISGFDHQLIMPVSQVISPIGSASSQEAQAHQLRGLTEAARANVRRSNSRVSGPHPVVKSTRNSSFASTPTRLPVKISAPPLAPDEDVSALSLGSLSSPEVADTSDTPGLLRRISGSQQDFNRSRGDTDVDSGSEDLASNLSTRDVDSKADAEQHHSKSKTSIARDLTILSADKQPAASKLGTNCVDAPARDSSESPNLLTPGTELVQPTESKDCENYSSTNFKGEDDITHVVSSEELVDSKSDKQQSVNTIKSKRKKTRHALQEASSEREVIRKRVASTWTLEGAKGLEDATEKYLRMRSELAKCMASGELREEDVVAFPVLGKKDLAAPKKGQITTAPIPKKSEKGKVNGAENKQPSVSEADEPGPESNFLYPPNEILEPLVDEAIEARDKYIDALDYMTRSPPNKTARGNLSDARKPFEARIQAATKRYHKKREAVKALFPDGVLPNDIEQLLEVFNDKDEKELRDMHLPNGALKAAPSKLMKTKWSTRRGL